MYPLPALETAKANCQFWGYSADNPWAAADEEVRMSHAQNLLYWWFATNIYSIHGAGNRLPLPCCLIRLIRRAYASPSAEYTNFDPGYYVA